MFEDDPALFSQAALRLLVGLLLSLHTGVKHCGGNSNHQEFFKGISGQVDVRAEISRLPHCSSVCWDVETQVSQLKPISDKGGKATATARGPVQHMGQHVPN